MFSKYSVYQFFFQAARFLQKRKPSGFSGFRYRCIVLVATLLRSTATPPLQSLPRGRTRMCDLQSMLTVFVRKLSVSRKHGSFLESTIPAASSQASSGATSRPCHKNTFSFRSSFSQKNLLGILQRSILRLVFHAVVQKTKRLKKTKTAA